MNKEKQRRLLIGIVTALVVLAFVITGLGLIYVFLIRDDKGGPEEAQLKPPVTAEEAAERISVLTELPDALYIYDVAPEFRLEIKGDPEKGITLYDDEENLLSFETEERGDAGFELLPPKDGYTPGAHYKLILSPGSSFADERLKSASTLFFSVYRKPLAHYVCAENTKEVKKEIQQLDEEHIVLPDKSYEEGDIVIAEGAEGEAAVFKIESLDGNKAEVSTPALDEIYEELEFSDSFELEDGSFTPNEEITEVIREGFGKSEGFASLKKTLHAAETKPIEVKVKPDYKKSSIKVTVKVYLGPERPGGSLLKGLANHNMTLTFESELKLKVRGNISKLTNMDISVKTATDSALTLTLESAGHTSDWAALTQGADSAPSDQMTALCNSLSQLEADIIEEKITLGQFTFPTPVPGLLFNLPIKFVYKFDCGISLNATVSERFSTTVGMSIVKGKINPYFNMDIGNPALDVNAQGKLETQVGLALEPSLVIFSEKIAAVKITGKTGAYMDIYAIFPLSFDKNKEQRNQIHAFLEPGLFFDVSASAHLKLKIIPDIKAKLNIYQKDLPFESLCLGSSKIALELKTEGKARPLMPVQNEIPLPEFEWVYYDVKAGRNKTKALSPGDLNYTLKDSAGNNVRSKIEGSSLKLAEALSSDAELILSYSPGKGQQISCVLDVLKGAPSGSNELLLEAGWRSEGEVTWSAASLLRFLPDGRFVESSTPPLSGVPGSGIDFGYHTEGGYSVSGDGIVSLFYQDGQGQKDYRLMKEANGEYVLRSTSPYAMPEKKEDSPYGEYVTPYFQSVLPLTSDEGLKAFLEKGGFKYYSGVGHLVRSSAELRDYLKTVLQMPPDKIYKPDPADAYWILQLDQKIKVPGHPKERAKVILLPLYKAGDIEQLAQWDGISSAVLVSDGQLSFPKKGKQQLALLKENPVGILREP